MSKLFLFIDESGNPGTHPDSSSYYQVNILVSNKDGIQMILEDFARFRFFLDFGKELKDYWAREKLRKKLKELVELLLIRSNGTISAHLFYLDKKNYTGPYLNSDGTKFRNFIMAKSLEKLFSQGVYDSYDSIELIIDRYLESEIDQENLKEYLRGNYKLPRSHTSRESKFHQIVHVDSVYCESLQFSDLLGRYYREYGNDLNIVQIQDISDMKKGSDALEGTKPFSPINK